MSLSNNMVNMQQPYLRVQDNVVDDMNEDFTVMTGYSREEIKGKAVLYVLNDLLKMNKSVNSVDELNDIESFFFFNKISDFKEASIKVQRNRECNIIYLIFQQCPLISINNSLSYTHQLISDNLVGIAIYSAEDFTLLKASKEYERIICDLHQVNNIVGKKVSEFHINWMKSLARVSWEKAIHTKSTVQNLEHSILNPTTGKIEYFDASVAPILDGNRVKFLVVSMNNVTEKVNYRIENEKKALMIEKQKELLETVIEKQKDSVFIIDKQGNIILNNKSDEGEYGKQLFTIRDLYHAIDYYDESGNRLSFEEMPIHRVMNGEEINDIKLKLKRGNLTKYLNLNGTPIYDKEGKFEYAFLFGQDMTEVMVSRQLIVNQKEQLEAIMENMSDAIFIIDGNGKYILQNKSALEYFGTDLKQVGDAAKAAKYFEMDGEEITLDEMPEAMMLKGIETKDKVIHIQFPRKEIYVSVSATPIFDKKGNYVIGVLSSRDITEYIKRNETIKEQHIALLIAEKKEKENLEKVIAMKDEFLSLISHEFKTPLTVINSALQTLELVYSDQLTEKVKSYMDKIKQNTYRQVRLVNNLLDITRANAGHVKLNIRKLDVVFMTKMIVESVSPYALQKCVNIRFACEHEEKLMALDEEKYERILLNLLSNAIKFTSEGKQIIVELVGKEKGLILKVTDEGIGIPKDKQEMIFERFGQVDSSYTRQVEGSGIGLSLVKLMVSAMGGNISVDSQVGTGSSFCVELPELFLDNENNIEALRGLVDNRLIQSIAIEFSDIYF
ncbi:MAG: domain S-box protein [Clostridia bacterium]|nr:domain S-box protein [Clostridia bacterium]